MQIVSQTKDIMIPCNGLYLKTNERGFSEILSIMPNGHGKVMAVYTDYSRAHAIMDEVINNIAAGEREVYTFPAE